MAFRPRIGISAIRKCFAIMQTWSRHPDGVTSTGGARGQSHPPSPVSVRDTRLQATVASATSATWHALVFTFHGHGGNAQGTAQQMHLQTVWPQAIVVYPQGLPSPTPGDPSGTKPGWQFKTGDSGDRDLKLFDAMVATLKH